MNPAVGSVAWWDSCHVAWVEAVNGDSVTIEEYNNYQAGGWGLYYERTINRTDVSGYIHIKDIDSEPADPLVEGHEADNPIAVKPYDTILYTLLADTAAAFDCPAVGRIRLTPVVFPEARLTVQPEALTYDHPLLTAHDNSRRTTRRQWILVPYPAADSLRPAESGPTLSWQAPLVGLDSLTVVLAIGDNYCADTASRTVPFVRHLLWAPNIFVATDPDSRFAPVATGLTAAVLSIYNRQGLLVHRTDDLATGWDGTRDGTPCPQGAYVWHLRYQSDLYPGIWRTATGTVTLVR